MLRRKSRSMSVSSVVSQGSSINGPANSPPAPRPARAREAHWENADSRVPTPKKATSTRARSRSRRVSSVKKAARVRSISKSSECEICCTKAYVEERERSSSFEADTVDSIDMGTSNDFGDDNAADRLQVEPMLEGPLYPFRAAKLDIAS